MKFLAYLLFTSLVLTSVAQAEEEESGLSFEEEESRIVASFQRLGPIVSQIRMSDDFALLEYFNSNESDADEKTVERFGYRMKKVSKNLSEDDRNQLIAVIQNSETFEAYRGAKACEFYPTFALIWSNENREVEIHVCLRCHEIKVYAGEEFRVHCDIRDEAYKGFRKLLESYNEGGSTQ